MTLSPSPAPPPLPPLPPHRYCPRTLSPVCVSRIGPLADFHRPPKSFGFGRAFGARPETLTGLSGLGDLILTCSTPQSRNYALGLSLGRTNEFPPNGKLAEGALTASVLVAMAERAGIDMPIARAVEAVLSGRGDIEKAIGSLPARPPKAET